MNRLPKEARTRNVSADEFCRWCGDSAWVVAQLRPAVQSTWMRHRKIQPSGWYEEVAPCPYCESGWREEFPEPGPNNKRPSRPAFPHGYWQHIDEADINPSFPNGFKPLSLAENRRRWREELGPVIGRVAKSFDDPDVLEGEVVQEEWAHDRG